MMIRLISIISLFYCVFYNTALAQPPADYYSETAGLSGESLKRALHNIIDDHIEYPYSSSTTDTWDILKEADRDPENPQNILCIYSGFSIPASLEYNNGKGWNREHVWAKSRGNFGTRPGAGTDLHHLRAVDVSTNSARNNRNFDEAEIRYIDQSGIYSGVTASFTSTDEWIWEPRDETKGDVARMMFYMAVRYEGDLPDEPDLELVEEYQPADSKIGYHSRLSTLLRWHKEDPVEDNEKRRNEIIFSYQKNRNPFIDHPEFVELIWVSNPTVPLATNVKSIIPAPSTDFWQELKEQKAIRIINSTGHTVISCNGDSCDELEIKLNALENDTYYLFYWNEQDLSLKKFIIK